MNLIDNACPITTFYGDLLTSFDARVEEGRNSVYGIARKLQKTVFDVVMSQTHAEKLYAKILL